MKVFIAQESAEQFREFLSNMASAIRESPSAEPAWIKPTVLFSDEEWQAIPGAFTCLTDWLQAWCLTGRGIDVTRGEYVEYMQAVTMVLADAHRAVFKKLATSVFPKANLSAHRNGLVDPDQFHSATFSLVPIAITPEFYAACLRLDKEQRQRQLSRLIYHPEIERYFSPATGWTRDPGVWGH